MDRTSRGFRAALATGALLSVSGMAAAAFPDEAMGVYGAYGNNMHSDGTTHAPSIGLIVPWSGWTPWERGPGTTWYFDLWASQWRLSRVNQDVEHRSIAQIGAGVIWRHRLAEGSSPWFVEAGLGVSTTNHLYKTPYKQFSTTFNFVSQLGVGRSFGVDGRHEVSLRLQHHSNANIKKPNPGEDFVQLRYGYRF